MCTALYRFNTLTMPDSPSAQVSLASANVLATIAQRVAGLVIALYASHSAPVRVLPHPRPERISQVCQLVLGGSWFALACTVCH